MKRIAAIVCSALLSAGAAGADNWPTFRGPGATGIAQGSAPVEWDAEKGHNILWKTPIPGLAVSSPVVWGDRIFVTTAVSSDPNSGFRHGLYGDVEPAKDMSKHAWRVYAIDRSTGKIVWERTAHEGVPRSKRHTKASQASATPATDGKYVVAWFGSEGLYVYDFTGKLLWKKDFGVVNAGWFYDPDYEWGVASSPIIYKDMVILQVDQQKNSFIAAFRLRDGSEVWRTSREELPSWGTPTVVEGPRPEIITNATNFIRSYDPATGKELWRLGRNSEVTATTPFASKGLVYVVGGYPPIRPIYAIRPGGSGDLSPKDGQTSHDFLAWSKREGGSYMPTPLAYGDHLYIVQNNGVLSVYDAASGERIYQQRVGDKPGAYSASPVAADGKIYFTSEDGEIFVIKAGAKYELLGSNSMGEVLMATPAISGGVMYVRGMKNLYAVGPPVKAGEDK
ncbi:MAG TPA: PQQ-binding-like beta-propeller repeat protein [Candidatus Acidoferrales bacterium]